MYDPYADTVPPYERSTPYEAPPAPRRSQRSAGGARQPEQVLIDRATVHRWRPLMKALLALLGWSVTGITTVLFVLHVEQKVFDGMTWLGLLVGVALAVFLSTGEVFTSDTGMGAYLCFFVPDFLISLYELHGPLVLLWSRLLSSPDMGLAVGLVSAMIVSGLAAYLPERMVFGKRKKNRAR